MRYFRTLLFVALLLIPTGFSLADVENDDLSLQISAIRDYIEQVLDLNDKTPLTSDALKQSIHDGTMWLANAQEETGHFKYEYEPYDDMYLTGDNIVRQAGALYALGEVERRATEKDLLRKEAMENAIAFFEGITITDGRDDQDFSCISERVGSSKCVLGATSLALSGMLGYLEAYPEEIPMYEDLADNWLSYIMAMKKEDAGFRNVHRTNRTTQSDDESSFSNGEALLALVRYYQFDHRNDVKDLIDETFVYLSTTEFDVPLYLWMMAALKDMHTLWEDDAYITYGKAYTDWRVTRAQRFRGTNKNFCAYNEGVVSAYSLLKNNLDGIEKDMLRGELNYWNTQNKLLQIEEGQPYKVTFDEEGIHIGKAENIDIAAGGFLTGHQELTQRIDFTQHCITSYVQTLVDIEGETL